MGVIYKITSPSGKLYIGKTYDLRKRVNAHKCSAKKEGSKIILHNSIKKYGWENHILEVVEEVEDVNMDEREIFWITELKTYCYENPMGLNMTKGGDGQRSTWMHKIELRKWFSERFTGEGSPFYGKHHTAETKALLSKLAKERNKKDGRRIPDWGAAKGRLKCIKEVAAYNSVGELIGEFESLTICASFFNIKSSRVSESACHGIWISGKYLFRFKEGAAAPKKISVGVINIKQEKKTLIVIYGYNRKEYPSAIEAATELGIPVTTIRRAATYNNGRAIRTGHSFIYKDSQTTISSEMEVGNIPVIA